MCWSSLLWLDSVCVTLNLLWPFFPFVLPIMFILPGDFLLQQTIMARKVEGQVSSSRLSAVLVINMVIIFKQASVFARLLPKLEQRSSRMKVLCSQQCCRSWLCLLTGEPIPRLHYVLGVFPLSACRHAASSLSTSLFIITPFWSYQGPSMVLLNYIISLKAPSPNPVMSWSPGVRASILRRHNWSPNTPLHMVVPISEPCTSVYSGAGQARGFSYPHCILPGFTPNVRLCSEDSNIKTYLGSNCLFTFLPSFLPLTLPPAPHFLTACFCHPGLTYHHLTPTSSLWFHFYLLMTILYTQTELT